MNILSWAIYIPLQILLLPIVLLGALLVAYKQIVISKRLGLSMTAIEVINGRWSMHLFGIREDEATTRLAAALPNTSLFGLWLSLFPLWAKFKISGRLALYPRVPAPGSEKILDLIIARTQFFDRIVERSAEQIDQFVVLGAGYDTRAYGKLRREGLSFFELDQPNMQAHKLATLEMADIDFGHVTFVSVDFSVENAMQKLISSGFDVSKKTLFLWEGVTLYLSEEDVRKTMRDIRHIAAVGSVLVADIYAERFVALGGRASHKKTLERTGEALIFGLDFSAGHEQVLSNFVESELLTLGECFYLGSSNEEGPFVAVAEMKIEPAADA